MIIIHPLKVAFLAAPKTGSTSLFAWFHQLLFGHGYQHKGKPFIHEWFQRQQTELISNVPLKDFRKPEGFLVFCVTRDPIKRFLSAYSNRVLHHDELGAKHPNVARLAEAGLRRRPSLDFYLDHIEDYHRLAGAIHYHNRPMVDFYGRDITIYDRIFDLSKMRTLREELIAHWKQAGLGIADAELPEIPRTQTGGPKLGLELISPAHCDWLMNYYRDDYATFTTLDREKTLDEWKKTREQHAVTVTVEIKPLPPNVEFLRTGKEVLAVSVGRGNIEPFGGMVLLKPELIGKHRLVLRDVRGDTDVQWGLPSPKLHVQFPANPRAGRARFRVEEARIALGTPAELYLVDPNDNRELLLVVSMRPGND